jgi:hypothetical protein
MSGKPGGFEDGLEVPLLEIVGFERFAGAPGED